MSQATLNGIGVVSGDIRLPLTGRWVAELVLQTNETAQVTGRATLIVGSTTLVGTSSATVDEGGLVTATVVGGANGLDKDLSPQHFQSATIRTVLSTALITGGETLSPLSDASILDTFLPQATQTKGIVADALRRFVPKDAVWRVLIDGTIWVGQDLWLPVELDYVLESEEPQQERFILALEGVSVLPGTTLRGKRVSFVRYVLGETSLRAEVSYGQAVSQEARELAKLVDRQVSERTDFSTAYLCRVVGQNGDGSLELVSTDPRIPNMSRVPARAGIPGVASFQIVPGSTMAIVEFENGNKEKPFVSDYALGTVQSLSLQAVQELSLMAPQVKAGGDLSLAKAIELIAFASNVVSALGALGVPISPLSPSVSTQVLKGS